MSTVCEIRQWQISSYTPATGEATRTHRVGLFLLVGAPGRCIPAKSPDRVTPIPLDFPLIFGYSARRTDANLLIYCCNVQPNTNCKISLNFKVSLNRIEKGTIMPQSLEVCVMNGMTSAQSATEPVPKDRQNTDGIYSSIPIRLTF